jgi:hypothetical protein
VVIVERKEEAGAVKIKRYTVLLGYMMSRDNCLLAVAGWEQLQTKMCGRRKRS